VSFAEEGGNQGRTWLSPRGTKEGPAKKSHLRKRVVSFRSFV